MKKLFLFIIILGAMISCSHQIYKPKDYAYACVNKTSTDLDDDVSDVCLPIDTYDDYIKFHVSQPYEMRKLPTLDERMD